MADTGSSRSAMTLVLVVAAVLVVGAGAFGVYWLAQKPRPEPDRGEVAVDAGRQDGKKPAPPAAPPTVPPVKEPISTAPAPRRIFGRDRESPHVIPTVGELVARGADLKGQWVRVTGTVDRVTSLAGDTVGSVEAVYPRPRMVLFSFPKGNWKKDLVGVNDTVEVLGRVENGTQVFTTIYPAELVRRTPAASEPSVEITATDLTRAFAADPAAATAKYRMKYLKVTGQVRLKAPSAAPGGILGLEGVKDPNSAFNLRVVGQFVADQKAATDAVTMGSTATFVGRLGNVGLAGHDLRLTDCRLAK